MQTKLAWEEVVRRARLRDAAAFAELIGGHERAALAVAFALLGDAAGAGDVVQDAFVRAWQRLDDLKDPARFGPWLVGIVRNLAIDALRRQRREPRADSENRAVAGGRASPDPGDELARRESGDAVAAALQSLDELSRSAVVLRYYEGLSSRQIGELLGLAPAAVDMRLTRARRQLRDTLSRAELAPDSRPPRGAAQRGPDRCV